MKKTHRGLLAVVLAGALVVAACSSGNDRSGTAATSSPQSTAASSAKVDPVAFRTDMRKLWEDHVQWTRLYIVSAVAGLPDADATLTRLLQNQTDIGNAVAGFYGNDAGAKLTTLLKGHIATAGEIITAAKASDNAAVTKASTAWYANADEIASFLAGANPAWPAATLKDMMKTHLDQTLAEATAQLTGDYAKSVSEYDHIVTHIVDMADALSSGIVTQFPDRFTK
ncbi:MAG: hypothetical protein ABIY48_06165 [Acidimicrobiales bacterium]